MTLMSGEFEEILQDISKTIEGDIVWQNHPQHDLLLKFKAKLLLNSIIISYRCVGLIIP